jgi:phosphomannomutase
MRVNPNIFRAYDIRGKYPEELNAEAAYRIGRAFVKLLNKKNINIAVGRDMRLSSPILFRFLTKGILDEGANVADIDLSTTPMLYFGVARYGFDGGINITGSHIPGDSNGFKLVRKKAVPISGETGIQEIKKIVMECQLEKPVMRGKISQKNILNDYIENALNFVDRKAIKKLKIVVDTGNGMGGTVASPLFKKLKCQIIPLYFELDGSFPHHIPNPLVPENLVDLQKKVLEKKADLGIALDGDADRVMFIDNQGKAISGDFITAFLAKSLLKNNPGEKILYDVRSSWVVKEEIEKNGGMPVVFRVGHSFIKEKMRKDNILFAGELSGHYYLRDNYFIESPLIIILKIIEILSKAGKTFSEIIRPLRRYFSSGEINFRIKNPEKAMKKLEEKYQDAKNIFHLDGLSVEYENWWFNIRLSNTENLLRLNLEAKTKELMEEKKKELSSFLSEN